MAHVSIIPPWPELHQNDALFAGVGFREWRTAASAAGFHLHTHDVLAPRDADIVWCIDLAEDIWPLWSVRNLRRAGKPVVLQILESPLVKPLSHYAALQKHFTALLTYGAVQTGEPRHYHCRIPVDLSPVRDGLVYASRWPAVMMNTNQHANLTRVREAAEHPVLGSSRLVRRLRGWRTARHAHRAELYSWRRHLARAVERFPPHTLDVFGRGWRGEIPGEPAYRCADSAPDATINGSNPARELDEKLNIFAQYRFTIAAENYRGSRDYISEKIIHPLLAGSVPVYLGDENIASVVPPAAFIDARRFRDPARLLQHLVAYPADAWHAAQQAGRAWLLSAAAQTFSGDTFARTAMQVLSEVTA